MLRLAEALYAADFELGVVLPGHALDLGRNPNATRDSFVYACLGPAGHGAARRPYFHYIDLAREELLAALPHPLPANPRANGGLANIFEEMSKKWAANFSVRLGGARVHGLLVRLLKHAKVLVVRLINEELRALAATVDAGALTEADRVARCCACGSLSRRCSTAPHSRTSRASFST